MQSIHQFIKVYSTCTKVNSVSDFVEFLCLQDLSLKNSLVWDDTNPDIVVSSIGYLFDSNEKKDFTRIASTNAIRVFFANEYLVPDFNLFDYCIGWDTHLSCGIRYIRMPLYYNLRLNSQDANLSFFNNLSLAEAKSEVVNRKFCSFIYSNPNAHPVRDQIFFELSKYMQVDSLGMHLHNTDIKTSRYKENWCDISVDLKSKYKFSISAENCCADGYVTEKIFTSFMAHSIPIYFGSPCIEAEFNQQAFINVNQYKTFNQLIEAIISIDGDSDKWIEMAIAPWQTEEQRNNSLLEIEAYLKFWERILSKTSLGNQIRPIGTVPDNYFNQYKCYELHSTDLLSNCINKIKKLPYKLGMK